MSLQIAVAHTGQRLDADPVAFSSVDALKYWISRATEIPPESQILLTTHGKHVKLQALLTEVSQSNLSPKSMLIFPFRKRYMSTVASSPTTHRQPSRPPLFQKPLPPMIPPTPFPTTRICEHGRHFSKPAATGLLAFSKGHTPCLA